MLHQTCVSLNGRAKPEMGKGPASSVNVASLFLVCSEGQRVLGGRKAQEQVSEPAVVFLSLLSPSLLSHTAR